MTKCPRCKKEELVPIAGSEQYYECKGGCKGVYQKFQLKRLAG